MLRSWQRVVISCLFFTLREVFAEEIDHSVECRLCNGYQICGRREFPMPECNNGFPCTREQYHLCGKIDDTMRHRECERPGKFPIPKYPNKFFTCDIDYSSLIFKKHRFRCANHTTFDVLTRRCMTADTKNFLSTLKISDIPDMAEKQKFSCRDPGIFPDPHDCKMYHSCNAKLESQDFYCDFGKYFDGSDCTTTKSRWCMEQLAKLNEEQTQQRKKIYMRIKQLQARNESTVNESVIIPAFNKSTETKVTVKDTEIGQTTANVKPPRVDDEYKQKRATAPLAVDERPQQPEGNYKDEISFLRIFSPRRLNRKREYEKMGTIGTPGVMPSNIEDKFEEGTTESTVGEITSTLVNDDYTGMGTTGSRGSEITSTLVTDDYTGMGTTGSRGSEITSTLVTDDYTGMGTTGSRGSEIMSTLVTDDYTGMGTTGSRGSEIMSTLVTDDYTGMGTTGSRGSEITTTLVTDEYTEMGTTGSRGCEITSTLVTDEYTEMGTTGSSGSEITSTLVTDEYTEMGTTGSRGSEIMSTLVTDEYTEMGTTGSRGSEITSTLVTDEYTEMGTTESRGSEITSTLVTDEYTEMGTTGSRGCESMSTSISLECITTPTPYDDIETSSQGTTFIPTTTPTTIRTTTTPTTIRTTTTPITTTPTTTAPTTTTRSPLEKLADRKCGGSKSAFSEKGCRYYYRCKKVWKHNRWEYAVTRHDCGRNRWWWSWFDICIFFKPVECYF